MQTERKIQQICEKDDPKRYKKKDLKLKSARTVYICQCDKKFLSFPAIYSHSRNKHNVKLTSKVKSNRFKKQYEGNQEKIYFKWSEYNCRNGNIKNKVNTINEKKNTTNQSMKSLFTKKINNKCNIHGVINIYGAVNLYLEQCLIKIPPHSILQISDTIFLLMQCINSHYMIFDQRNIHQDYCQDNHPQLIPYFFNFFLLWYLPSNLNKRKKIIKNLSDEEILKILYEFGQWLKYKGFTYVECLANQGYILNKNQIYSNEQTIQIKLQ